MRKKLYQIVALLLFILIGYYFVLVKDSGFPDGYISPYDRFYNEYLSVIFLIINFLFMFTYMAFIFFKNPPSTYSFCILYLL